jgi:hypothetical protein
VSAAESVNEAQDEVTLDIPAVSAKLVDEMKGQRSGLVTQT